MLLPTRNPLTDLMNIPCKVGIVADTLDNIVIPPSTWVDLYSSSGITVGDQISVQNTSACDMFLTTQALEPTGIPNHQVLRIGQSMVNDLNDNGAWAFCGSGGQVNVRRI